METADALEAASVAILAMVAVAGVVYGLLTVLLVRFICGTGHAIAGAYTVGICGIGPAALFDTAHKGSMAPAMFGVGLIAAGALLLALMHADRIVKVFDEGS